jgi:pimeloyl-ACP methyl ester carboxylesterase
MLATVMKLTQTLQTLQILSRIAQAPRADAGPDPAVLEERDLRAPRTGLAYDDYRPRGRTAGAVIALHGVTVQGRRDARLVHFARSLARSGVACAVPSLGGLSDCRFRAEDLDELEELIALAAERAGERVGLIGFSYGGSYAVVTAARAAVAERVRFVLAFGPYHSLDELFAWYHETDPVEPASEPAWDNRIYLHLVLAHQLGATLGLPEPLRGEVRALLGRFCHDASAEEKRRFFEERLRSLGLVAEGLRRRDRVLLDALSPAGKLAPLRCPVSVIHDLHDTIVPPGQGERLHAELCRLDRPERFRLLVTPLLSHVDLSALRRLGDIKRLVSTLSVIFGDP